MGFENKELRNHDICQIVIWNDSGSLRFHWAETCHPHARITARKDPANAEAGFVDGLTPQNLGTLATQIDMEFELYNLLYFHDTKFEEGWWLVCIIISIYFKDSDIW